MNGINKNKITEFITTLSDKSKKIYTSLGSLKKKTVIFGFLAVLAAVACISTFILIEENTDKKETTAINKSNIDSVAVTAAQVQPMKGSFLFALTDNENTQILSLLTADFDSEKKSLSYKFISPRTQVNLNGTLADLNNHFISGGKDKLLLAVNKHMSISFDRYIIGNEDSFTRLMQLLGNTTVSIENEITYEHNGVGFKIEAGEQSLAPDMMLKYYLYLASQPDSFGDEMIEIIIDCFERLVTCEDDSELENRFCTAIGYFDTDISAFDFSNYKELLKALPEMKLGERAASQSY